MTFEKINSEEENYDRRLKTIFSYLPPEFLKESRQLLSKKEQLRQIIKLVREFSVEDDIKHHKTYDDYCGLILRQIYESNKIN